MKLIQLSANLLLSSFLTVGLTQEPVPFSDPRWVVQAQGQLKEAYKGYNSLYLQNGIAYLKDEKFQDGIIEFDIFLSPRASFSGLIFRVADPNNYEELYLRSHQSANPDAYQYTPVFNNDPAWQLYHDPHDAVNDGFVHWKRRGKIMGFNTVLEFPFDRWLHVKLLVKGTQAELYLDNSPEPSAFIRELKMGNRSGSLGVKSGNGAVWFANFQFKAGSDIEFKTKPDDYRPATPAGTITSWEVSTPLREKAIESINEFGSKWLNDFKWTSTNTETTGLLNLARFSSVTDSTNTILVKTVVTSYRDEVRKLSIGYSDRVRVYCNGDILYSGNATFRTRDYRYLGTIGYFDAVYMPLKKGENTIVISVSETFGGWGIMGKWD